VQIFWDENIEFLKKKDRLLHQRVTAYTMGDVGNILPTDTVPTFRFHRPGKKYEYACHPLDPIREIMDRLPILKNENKLNETVCIFIGMGLGYSQKLAFEQREDIFRMIILEPSLDMFCLALKYVDLRPLIQADKVFIFAGDIDWDDFNTTISNKKIETDFLISDDPALFDWNPDLYKGVKNKAHTCASRVISGFGTLNQFGEQLFKNRIANLTLFRESNPVDVLKGAFSGKPAVLVSAGPSLEKSMELLKKAVGHCVMIAVDSAVAPLLQNGITPDIVTTLDFRNLNSEKLSPDIIGPSDFSLVAAIVTSPRTVKRLSVKNLFFSFQENDTQNWILKALNIKHQLPPVNTVALLSLGFAQIIEADPIVLVGHDFALTSTTDDHAKGTVISEGWHLNPDTIAVPGVDGKPVKTLGFLLEFKQNFEQLIKGDNRNYINATASGAQIEGTDVLDLASVMATYMDREMSASDIMDAHTRTMAQSDALSFIKAAQEELAVAGKTFAQVQKMINLNAKIELFLKGRKKNFQNILCFSQLPSKIQAVKQKIIKLRAGLTLFMAMEEVAAEKVIAAKKIQELEVTKNYLELLAKESRVMGLEMQGHRCGLEVFIQSVGDLVLYLKKEDRLLTKITKNRYDETDLIELGKLYLGALDAVKAQKILERCRLEYPDSARAMLCLGEARAHLLDFDAAFRYWEDAGKKEPSVNTDIIKTRKALAQGWIQRGEKDPFIFEMCLGRAFQLWDEKEFCVQQKEAEWARCAGLMRQRLADKKIGQVESALMSWGPVRDFTPEWYYLMARVFSEKNGKSEALSHIETALKKQPDHPEWMSFRARLLLETDQFDQGIACLEKAVALDSAQAILWEELGDTLFGLKDFTTAAIAYEKCFAALPDKVDVLRKFGDCHFHTHQFEVAQNAYLVVLEKDSGNEMARANLDRIKP